MKYGLLILVLVVSVLVFPACEAFQQIIHETIPPPDQLSPSGVVLMFKQAADSMDVDRALEYLSTKSGKRLSAMERYDYGDELQRYLNRIHGRYVRIWDVKSTHAEGDSVMTVSAEFDWLFFWQFKTRRIGERWYIAEIQEENP